MGSSMRCEEPGGSTPSGLRTGVRLFDFVSGWFDSMSIVTRVLVASRGPQTAKSKFSRLPGPHVSDVTACEGDFARWEAARPGYAGLEALHDSTYRSSSPRVM
jgi:hypothetical protein